MSNGRNDQNAAPESPSTGVLTDRVTEIKCESCGCLLDLAGFEPFSSVECPDCHTVQTVPAKLGHFLLQRLLGTGGMGCVYIAKDESLGRSVAIKVMLESIGKDQQLIDTFKREAQAVAKLNHPNIAQVYSFGMERGQPYIVMELVSGERLDRLVSSGQVLDEGLIMKIGLEMAEALAAADEIGLIHGDIKPENILFDEKWKGKLVDFGLAHFHGQAQEQGIWGTPYYIAPEKVKHQKVDARSDIYSLGATLYHALTGRPPFEGSTPIEVVKARLDKNPAPPSRFRANLTPRVEQIVMRMLENMPAKRYPTYSSLISDLKEIVKTLGADRKDFAGLNRKTVKMMISKKTSSPMTISSGTIGVGASSKNISTSSRNIDEPPKPGSIKIAKRRSSGLTVSSGIIKDKEDMTAKKEIKKVGTEASSLDAYKKNQMQSARQRSASSSSKSILLIPILGLIAAVGTVVLVVMKEKIRHRKEVATEYHSRQAAIKAANDVCAEIHMGVTNIIVMEMKALTLQESASNAVFTLLNEHLVVDIRGLEPQRMVPAPATPEAPAEPGTSEPKPREPAPSEPVAPAARPAEPVAPAAGSVLDNKGREAPAGQMTREQIEAMRKNQQPKKPEESKAEPVAKPVQRAPKPKVLAPVEPEFKTLARKVFQEASRVLERAQSARESDESAITMKNQVVLAEYSEDVWAGVKALKASVTYVADWQAQASEAMVAAESAFAQMTVAKAKFEREREEQRLRDEQARAEQEKKRKEEEYKALVQTELQLAEQTKINLAVPISQYKFKEAVDTLTSQIVNFKSEEGRTLMTNMLDRCTRVEALQRVVVARLAKGMPWGYYDAAVKTQIDVDSADENEIRLGTGKSVLWNTVTPAQMKRFIDYAILNEKPELRAEAEFNLAAAIYFNMRDDAKLSKTYADKTVELSPGLQAVITVLIPGL